MPEFVAIRIGSALVAADEDSAEKMLRIPERRPFKSKVTVPRDDKTHATFFGVIGDVCKRWPPSLEPYPDGDPELLRAYLLCAVGWRESYRLPIIDDAKDQQRIVEFADAMVRRARQHREFPFLRETMIDGQPALAVHYAKSIEHKTVDEVEFRDVADRVYAKIYELTEIDVEDLIVEHKTRKQKEPRAA